MGLGLAFDDPAARLKLDRSIGARLRDQRAQGGVEKQDGMAMASIDARDTDSRALARDIDRRSRSLQ